jgi:hypothetical protein
MTKAACSEEVFISLWREFGSASQIAKILNVTERKVNERRRRVEEKLHIKLMGFSHKSPDFQVTLPANGVRVKVDIDDGVILVGSDAHYWPGIISTAHRAFVVAVKELNPKMVIMNGDAFDGANISRHPRIGWEAKPSVKQELEACRDRISEIEAVAKNAKLHWTWGNHDIRWNSKLSSQVSEFEGIHGMNLADHFPRWKFSTSVMVNNHTQIKHRNYNGIHAAYNATLKSGMSTVNGHLHSLKVMPWTDLTGTRYGVDTGSLADVWGAQFEYTEDGTRNHRSGFAVLTFREGNLLPPELVEVIDEDKGLICFRGQVVEV